MKPVLRPLPVLVALFGVVACSGSVATAGNGDGGGGGGGPACAPTQHRAATKTCAASSAPSLPDGGSPPSCATDTDCTTAGSGYSYCRGGQCSFDACLSDADCTNGVCGCSTDYSGGNAQYHPNICVPATCHVDSDCGAGGLCAPSFGRCGTFDSYNCASSSAPACSTTESCSYSAEVGGFACGAPVVCNG